MPRLHSLFGCLAGLALVAAGSCAMVVAEEGDGTAAIRAYIAKDDPSYGWKVRRSGSIGSVQYVELILTSQTWQNIPWKHQLFIIKPEGELVGNSALMMIAGGSWNDSLEAPPTTDEDLPREAHLLAQAASAMKAPVVVLKHVPQQPIFNGMKEDEIISHTFVEFMKTGDPEWPLLVPMTKSAVRAMDAVQQYSKLHWQIDIEKFTVTGGSKRGWTTWLAGANDDRVHAIAPIVIDVVNMGPQMKHQIATWGVYSEQIADYSTKNLPQFMETEKGRSLLNIVDPYSYRESLLIPKMMILGTNDRYWPVDALNLYWDGLQGDKYIVYCPNQGHGIQDFPRVVGALNALQRAATGQAVLPKMDWKFSADGAKRRVEVSYDKEPGSANVWMARSETRDMRDSEWTSEAMNRSADGYHYELELPKEGYVAVYCELNFENGSLPFGLCTNLHVYPEMQPPAADDTEK